MAHSEKRRQCPIRELKDIGVGDLAALVVAHPAFEVDRGLAGIDPPAPFGYERWLPGRAT